MFPEKKKSFKISFACKGPTSPYHSNHCYDIMGEEVCKGKRQKSDPDEHWPPRRKGSGAAVIYFGSGIEAVQSFQPGKDLAAALHSEPVAYGQDRAFLEKACMRRIAGLDHKALTVLGPR